MKWRLFRHNKRLAIRTSALVQLMLLSCCLVMPPPTRADLVQAIDITATGIDYHNDASWSLGYEFYLAEDISLRALGYYDAGADGFEEDHSVGLWDMSGELLASTVITTNSMIDNWFRWESIAPVNLYANTRYVIAGFSSIDDYMWNPDEFQVDTRISLYCARYTFNTELAIPDDCYSEYIGFFGPNFLISDELINEPPYPAPAPPSVWLLLLGLFALAVAQNTYHQKRNQPSAPSRRVKLVTLMSLAGLLSQTAHALSVTAEPVQGDASWDGLVPLTSRYQRYSHDHVGATLEYDDIFDAEGNYIVPVGETLRWVWLRDNVQLGAMEFTYIGGPEHCWVLTGGQQQCGTFYKFLAVRKLRCEPDDKPFTMLAFQEGTEILHHNFDSERFKIKSEPSHWTLPTQFAVKRRSGQASLDTQTLSFIVEDDLNCRLRLKDVEVELQATILSGSNGHDHFGTSEHGTGKFTEAAGFPVERSEENTKVKGKTDVSGQFKVRYSAMDFALTEKVKLSFKRPAKDGQPESRLDASFIWDIQLLTAEHRTPDNLLEPEITPHTWDNGRGCIHNPAPRYLTPSASAMLPWALDEYTDRSGGATLRANDASLPWGGKIDIPGIARSGCHEGHRHGIAIDINRLDSQNRDIWTAYYGSRKLFSILENAMDNNGFTIFAEDDSIHYDFNPEPVLP